MITKADALNHLIDSLAGIDVTPVGMTKIADRIDDLATMIDNGTITIGSSVIVDSELSDESENPVQNKVVKAAIDAAGGGVSSWNDLTDKPFSVTTSATQLFSESVTTAEINGVYGAALTYSTALTADTLVVTFDGTDYTVSKTEGPETEGGAVVFYGEYGDGEYGESGPDFTNYPFFLSPESGTNYLFTETAGTYSVSASSVVATVTVTDDFALAVQHVIDSASSTANQSQPSDYSDLSS